MKFILNYATLIVVTFFILLAIIQVWINHSSEKIKRISYILGIGIISISVAFYIRPALIIENWNYLTALALFLTMITFLNLFANVDNRVVIVVLAIPFLLLESIFLFKIEWTIVHYLLLFSLLITTIIGLFWVFRKT